MGRFTSALFKLVLGYDPGQQCATNEEVSRGEGRWSEQFVNLKGPQVRVSWTLVGIAALGVVLMLFASTFAQQVAPATAPPQPNEVVESVPDHPFNGGELGLDSDIAKYQEAIARQLESILSQVAGAGTVKVSVYLASGPSYQFGMNENITEKSTEETDANGGTRIVAEITKVLQFVFTGGSQEKEQPVVSHVSQPEIKGVLVVADGATEPAVRASLIKAIETLLGLPAHRVTVLARQRGN